MLVGRVVQPVAGLFSRLAKKADAYPSAVVGVVFVGCFLALRIWSWTSSSPVLLARAAPARRAVVYAEFAQTSVAIVAVALTVLAILYALPDRPAIRELQGSDAWPRLQGLLLSVALVAVVALITAHAGTALDHASPGLEWLEELMLAAATTAILALLVGGISFTLLLYVGRLPPDPSEGRGAARRQWRQ